MPPLVCPSPNVIDQTFPRSNEELALVQKALLRLVELLAEGKCLVLLTQFLTEFIVRLDETFCWEIQQKYPEAQIIFYVLAQLGLQQQGVHRIDLSTIPLVKPHPLPKGCDCDEFSLRWSEELGRLYVLHSTRSIAGKYFIGVACTTAFAGKTKGSYLNPLKHPYFPLVGPDELGSLDDAYDWEIPPGTSKQKISFKDAYNKIRLLGGEVHQPSGSSHYPVKFKGKRTWPLDSNIDPVPDRFLKQLEAITGERLEVIKFVLLNGGWPRKLLKLP